MSDASYQHVAKLVTPKSPSMEYWSPLARKFQEPMVDKNGNPVLDVNGRQRMETDKTRQREYWLGQRGGKRTAVPDASFQHVACS